MTGYGVLKKDRVTLGGGKSGWDLKISVVRGKRITYSSIPSQHTGRPPVPVRSGSTAMPGFLQRQRPGSKRVSRLALQPFLQPAAALDKPDLRMARRVSCALPTRPEQQPGE